MKKFLNFQKRWEDIELTSHSERFYVPVMNLGPEVKKHRFVCKI